MTLEERLKPFKQVDEYVQERFTKIGRRIPDSAYVVHGATLPLLPLAIGLIASGINAFVPALTPVTSVYPLTPHIFFEALNLLAFTKSLELKEKMNGPVLAENPDYADPLMRFSRTYCRAVRLPMLIGAGVAAAKVGYDLAALVTGGEPLDGHTLASLEAGVGLFADSALIYLRDQNPSLPQRKPLKALLGKAQAAYERVKDALRLPVPSPLPQPVRAYSAFSNAGVQKH